MPSINRPDLLPMPQQSARARHYAVRALCGVSMLGSVLLFGGMLMIAPAFGTSHQPEDCPATLADLRCARTELTVQAPEGHMLAGKVVLP